MTTHLHPAEYVREFHETYGAPIHDGDPTLDIERLALRLDLIDEEAQELFDAAVQRDLTGVADALGDLVYVIYGMALETGIPLDDVLHEIHASNMSKTGLDGKAVLREDGKVLKGPNYFPPDIAGVIERHVHR